MPIEEIESRFDAILDMDSTVVFPPFTGFDEHLKFSFAMAKQGIAAAKLK